MQQKLIGDFIFQEKVYQIPPRTYHKCIRRNDQTGAKYYLSQTIQKPPAVAHLKQCVGQIKQVKGPNVLIHYDILETANNYYVFTEHCNEKTLEQMLGQQEIKSFQEDQARDYLRQILNGLKILHEHGISNPDLSLGSIFLHNGQIRVGQVNLGSTILTELDNDAQFQKYGLTKEVIAPEVLEGRPASLYSDLYEVGVVYYRMLFGKYPFNGLTKKDLLENMKKSKPEYKSQQISDESQDFLRQILVYDPSERLTWSNVYNHTLLKLLNIPSNMSNLPIEQSILLSQISINKIISRHDLNMIPFDVKENADFYQMNEKNTNSNVFKDTQFLEQETKQDIQDNVESYFKFVAVSDMIAFVENRAKTFKQQLSQFILQRNLYARYSKLLTNIRILSDDSLLVKQLEFLVLKAMLVLATSLKTTLLGVEPLAKQICDDENDTLHSEYANLCKLINKEIEIILQQFNNVFNIYQSLFTKSPEISDTFKQTYSKDTSMNVFPELVHKCKLYDIGLHNSPIAKKDKEFAELHLLRLNCYLIVSILFLRGKGNEINSVFGMEVRQYDNKLDTMNFEQLQVEHKRYKAKLEYLLL